MNAADHLPSARHRGDGDNLPAVPSRPRSEAACVADRCPCRATIVRDGRGVCTWHDRGFGEASFGLSDRLEEHRDWLDLHSELMRIHGGQRRGQTDAWVHRVRRFFAADESMHPTEHERKHIEAYLWRLREELAYRVGVEPNRPTPQVPMSRDPAWMSPQQRAIAKAAAGASLPTTETAERRQRRIAEYATNQGIDL